MYSTQRPKAENERIFLPLRLSTVTSGSVVCSMYGAFAVIATKTDPLSSDSARHSAQVNMYSDTAADSTIAF